jgi:ABC-type multidrug transport system ATPase subunit
MLESIIASVLPVLTTSSLRVDVGAVPVIEGLSLATTGEWVLVLGAARALFESIAGLRAIVQGEIRVAGLGPLQAVRAGVCAAAPLDPRLPLRWSPLEYISWSARLAGQPRDVAMSAASEAMEKLAISPFARARLGRASLAVRRATVVAAALATGAPLLVVEDPGVDLPPEASGAFLRLVVRALAGRRTAFFAARVSLESPVGLAADEAIVIDDGRVAIQGAPAQIASSEHAFSLRLAGDVRAFEGAVATRGARLLVPSNPATPTRLSLDIGPLTTTDLLRIALECNAVVLELRPLAGAFA